MPSSTSTSRRGLGSSRRRRSLWRLPLELLLLAVSLYWVDEGISSLLSFARPVDYDAFIETRESFDPQENYDVIAIGDSYIADAFVPDIFQAKTGLKGFNFGVYNASPFEWYYLMRDLLERGARPRYVLIGTNPRMFGMPASVGVHTPDFIKSLPLRLEMFWEAEGGDSVFKTVRHRYLLKTALRRLAGGQTPMPTRRIVAVDDGYLENVESMSPPAPGDAIVYQPLRPLSESQAQIRMFEQLLQFLKANGIVPVIVNPPVHATLLAAMEADDGYTAFRTTLASLAARNGAPVFDGRETRYVAELNTDDFLNIEHLRSSGARRFSKDLGQWFAKQQHLRITAWQPH